MIVHAENPGQHVTKCVTEYMDHNPLKRVPHPPYPPDLAPSDFYLFGYVKYQLQGHEFTKGAEFVSAISEILNQIPTNTLVNVFDDWMGRLRRGIDISGEYVEYRLFFPVYGFPRIAHSGDATVRVEHPAEAQSHKSKNGQRNRSRSNRIHQETIFPEKTHGYQWNGYFS
jgi:hypothetical protein